jgi:hypothetical protein
VPAFDWQLIVALAAVAGAAGFLIRRGLTLLRSGKKSKPACGSCGSCATAPSAPPTASTGFVPLESLVRDDQK